MSSQDAAEAACHHVSTKSDQDGGACLEPVNEVSFHDVMQVALDLLLQRLICEVREAPAFPKRWRIRPKCTCGGRANR